MRRYWWTVWIKVAVLAIVLLIAYNYASNKIEELVSPYLIEEETEAASEVALEEESEVTEEEVEEGNLLTSILGKIESVFDVKIDYENMIFDYANEYAQKMKEQSQEERNPISEPLS